MRKINWDRYALALCMAVFLCAGCSENASDLENSETAASSAAVEKEEVKDIGEMNLRDNDLLYSRDDETSVITMYLTVRRGNEAEGTNHSWEEVNSYSAYYYDDLGIDRYQVEGLLEVGDENGPVAGELGYGEKAPNATVQIRGQTSSRNEQKNYKIRLKDNKGLWNEQQTINLNKHQTDGLRFRNKLGFDLIRGIPQMVSLQTQFVHLYVKDETGGQTGSFEDYGLYTQVEQLNKKGMRAHGLDQNGHLYKINSCEFYRYEDFIKLTDDPTFDQQKFDTVLECKGNSDHAKLIGMLEDVNDYSVSSSELLEKHFDVENITYWMAYHILTGNTDTQNRNFYIYSPQNSEKWYIISWDNDGALRREENEVHGRSEGGAWECGISNYWGNILFQRCLKSEDFRKALEAAILEVKQYLSKERIDGMVSDYRSVVEPYIWRMPDLQYEPLTPENYNVVADSLSDEIDFNYQRYLDSLKNPMPFYIGVPIEAEGKLKIGWDVSYDFQSEDIIYTEELATDYKMENIIQTYEGAWPQAEFDMLPPGQYFVRVKARNSSGNEQYAFDYYVTENGKEYGIKCFYVLPDGTIEEDVYEE